MKQIVVDGNTACANIAYFFSEMAQIYPITPSSGMAELADEWSKTGKLNLFDMPVRVEQMQSEAGVAGALHGSLAAGALSTTFTSSQGLLLMIPNMFKMAGELLPAVIHVSARAVSTHALSIFAEHSDVMACRSTGFAMLCASNVQEAQDMALVSHLSAINSSVPFLHFFDGFRTSHEIQKINTFSQEQLKSLVPHEKIKQFKDKALNPSHPHQQGTAQNPDIFFQNKEASNIVYNQVYDHVCNAMEQVNQLAGTKYAPYEYYGSPNAKYVLVMMGSGTETAIETLQHLPSDFGVVKVRLYRPFVASAFCNVLPKTVERICVLDRTKEPGATQEPLCQDVISALNQQGMYMMVVGGRYGLGSKEFTPACVKAVFDNLAGEKPKNNFTVGIVDDVTHTSLDLDNNFAPPSNSYSMLFYGLGGDGTISANKNSIKIIGQTTQKFVQGYFDYDSKKSGSLTISHLRVSDQPILSTYKVSDANLIAIHNFNFVARYNILNGLRQGGTVLLNTAVEPQMLDAKLPAFFKKALQQKQAKLFVIDAQKIAKELELGTKINTIMQSAFFRLCDFVDFEVAKNMLKDAASKTYAKRGEKVLQANHQAIEIGASSLVEVDVAKFTLSNHQPTKKQTENEYYNNFVEPINSLEGNQLKVSEFNPNGSVPTNTTQFEKRGIASQIPAWISENCIQCGMCTLVCPHAAIRSVLVKEDDLSDTPDGFVTIAALGVPGARFKIQVSPLDCTGCGVCANVCPAMKKALEMVDMEQKLEQEKINWEYFSKLKQVQSNFNPNTVKGLQFEKPYFEYNYACAGCGETPYIKIASQLFGEHMMIANATGCSSIYSGSAPACPYTVNSKGRGPSWASSLLEDNAEFGLGMSFARDIEKAKLQKQFEQMLPSVTNEKLASLIKEWLEQPNSFSNQQADEMIELIKAEPDSQEKTQILSSSDFIAKKSVWIIGGDGWAGDIGYGGLEHLLATNQNVNVLVLDNEGYSNTGGQTSKSTPRGSQTKFSYGGKRTKKKDLGILSILNNNCYVASVGLGANMQQTITALKEAEQFDGPSIIIAYSPCVAHGYDMAQSQDQIKKAVKSGYWNLYRFNPHTQTLSIDSPPPSMSYEEFLMSEGRYTSIAKKFPEQAKQLFEQASADATNRYQMLIKLKQDIESKK
jgi:pyruvate-ferredoxin/flavodoxin oxidoreductase